MLRVCDTVFSSLLIIISLTRESLCKKIVHYDHSSHHEETLCWIIKLWDDHPQIFTTTTTEYSASLPPITGLTVRSEFADFPAHYTVCHDEADRVLSTTPKNRLAKKNSSESFRDLKNYYETELHHHAGVEWFSQEVIRRRQKRAVHFNDPAYPRQWHLHNKAERHMDINVTGVWEKNITGKGITVAVVDDGVQWRNPDLEDNYNYRGSWDLNDNDPDPSPDISKSTNHHGTRCAGEIAAVPNNKICGVGVAYEASIAGIRVLDGPMTDSLEASAFNKNLQVNDVYSCSWGPDDDGKTVDGPHIMAAKAMKYGVDFGRNGYGSIYIVASGNGGRNKDNCNYDGYANSIYTLTIGAVDEMGQMPYYAEECASMLGVTFSSGRSDERDIVTTDWNQHGGTGCTNYHTGTSAAAPLAAAIVALMLQAQPCLTWRDIQYIFILTAVKVDVDVADWQKNGAGLFHSHKHGFGLLKAWRMVNAARVWKMVPWMTSYTFGNASVDRIITKGKSHPLKVIHTVTDKDIEGYALYVLESVQVTVTIEHPKRGKLLIRLVSPSGTVSVIGAARPLDNSSLGFKDWTFSTVRCWGEKPSGTWKLLISDTDTGSLRKGRLLKWQVILFGTPITPEEFKKRRSTIETAMSGAYLNDSYKPQCEAPPVLTKPDIPISQKTLKILVLACAFCAVMAVYESLEYIFCYNEEKKEHKARMKLAARARNLTRESFGEHISPADAEESTGLLQSEDIPMDTFSIGTDLDESQRPQTLNADVRSEENELNLDFHNSPSPTKDNDNSSALLSEHCFHGDGSHGNASYSPSTHAKSLSMLHAYDKLYRSPEMGTGNSYHSNGVLDQEANGVDDDSSEDELWSRGQVKRSKGRVSRDDTDQALLLPR